MVKIHLESELAITRSELKHTEVGTITLVGKIKLSEDWGKPNDEKQAEKVNKQKNKKWFNKCRNMRHDRKAFDSSVICRREMSL